MAQKTNKSYAKRIKVTANGKLLTRTPGKNHFNAKTTRGDLQSKKGYVNAELPNRVITNNLPHAGAHFGTATKSKNRQDSKKVSTSKTANSKAKSTK